MSHILPESDPDRDPLKPEYRGFHITINSCSSDIKLIEPLREVWSYVVKNLSEFLLGREGSELIGIPYEYNNVERSDKFHKIHIHSFLTCKTTGISFIDLNKLRFFINRNLRQIPGFVRCNVFVEILKEYNMRKALENYIDKDPVQGMPQRGFKVMPLEDFNFS